MHRPRRPLDRVIPPRAWLGAALASLLLASGASGSPPPWAATESRAACWDFSSLRNPYFGDLHVHTSFSHDAYIRATRVTPSQAYDFARGETVLLPDLDGESTRPVSLERPLDFAAVTDHAEFFGEVRECLTPTSPGYPRGICVRMRQLADPEGMTENNALFSTPLGLTPNHHAFCNLPGADCPASAMTVWQEIQAAAEAAYDRGPSCSFTSLLGYEHTAAPTGAHLHRNVIFRNDVVPPTVASYLETRQGGAPQPLWTALENDCIDAGTGCDALTIPHNSNLSNGQRWPDPPDAADASRRQVREPLVEIYQHKASSECRFDRLMGLGADTTDELCSFEQDPRARQGPFPPPPVDEYPRRNMVRNTLKDGLVFDQILGVNPFKFGFVGGTDTHSGTAGAAREETWEGHRGGADADGPRKLAGNPLGGSQVRFSPGGLSVVWAEENSRDAIFEALARREVYATSGTRPVIRFFAGKLKGVTCSSPHFVERAYRSGSPMGGELGPVGGSRGPRFAVLALKDPGTASFPGTDLQRVQIVKGWADESGQTFERVYDVAGDADNGAGVDPYTCAPVGAGASELCAVWEDPEFDPDQRAFYYARVLENPTCRWSTRVCKSLGVDPFAPDCEAQAEASGEDLGNCCLDASNDAFMEPVIQERAWTSPIWVRPEGVTKLSAVLRPGRRATRGLLGLRLEVGAVPEGYDPAAEPLVLDIRDDDEIYHLTLPAGSLQPAGGEVFRYQDAAGSIAGVRVATVRVKESGGGIIRILARGASLPGADRSDHMVRVELDHGDLEARITRLWSSGGGFLRVGD